MEIHFPLRNGGTWLYPKLLFKSKYFSHFLVLSSNLAVYCRSISLWKVGLTIFPTKAWGFQKHQGQPPSQTTTKGSRNASSIQKRTYHNSSSPKNSVQDIYIVDPVMKAMIWKTWSMWLTWSQPLSSPTKTWLQPSEKPVIIGMRLSSAHLSSLDGQAL